MLPLFAEPEAPVPGDGPIRVLDVENRHHLLVHASTLDETPGDVDIGWATVPE
jgi:hypothetical protein